MFSTIDACGQHPSSVRISGSVADSLDAEGRTAYLFTYFDNQAAYANIGQRIGRLRWLQLLLGKQRAARAGCYVGDHLGGIMGNFLFGCMLGSTGVIGKMLGLPLDIRHIAFASANVGYAVTGI